MPLDKVHLLISDWLTRSGNPMHVFMYVCYRFCFSNNSQIVILMYKQYLKNAYIELWWSCYKCEFDSGWQHLFPKPVLTLFLHHFHYITVAILNKSDQNKQNNYILHILRCRNCHRDAKQPGFFMHFCVIVMF